MRLQPVYDIAEICSRHGITEAVVCPGSRCAPLTISFSRHPQITVRTISDERSAAFIAMGIAQQRKKPTVLICTSGSAAYNFAPAVAEAFYQEIPLLIITADRPTEWIGQRDGQTIAQQNIFGAHVKSFYQLPEDYSHADATWSFYRQVNEAVHVALQHPQGPVHINVPLREPLYPGKDEVIAFSTHLPVIERNESARSLSEDTREQLESLLNKSKRILVVAGQLTADSELLYELKTFSELFHAPIVGDVNSNLHTLNNAILRSDSFLNGVSGDELEKLTPDFLITIGKSTVSKNLKLFLRKYKSAHHWHVEESDTRIIDPFQSLTKIVSLNPADFFTAANTITPSHRDEAYLSHWRKREQTAKEKIDQFFQQTPVSEFNWVQKALQFLPKNANLHLANSLAVRYANWVGLAATEGVEVFCNRGTSGIDGCTSTAVGHSLTTPKLNVLITGDQAFFYDRNAFWHNYNTPNLRVLLLNNHGGAIFGVIDGPGKLPELNEYFITRQPSTAEHLANEFQLDYTKIDTQKTHDEVVAILRSFFETSTTAKILEVNSDAETARSVYAQFKETIKQSI